MREPNDSEGTISVVVPTLDEEARIGSCLASIGDRPGVEVVVTDGGSTDRTLETVAELRPDAAIVTGPAGRGGQLNRGAGRATSDRLLFLHADCVLPGGWFDSAMTALDDDSVSLVVFRLSTAPSDGHDPGPWERFWLGFFDLRSRGWGLPYGDQGFAMQRRVFDDLGGFPDIPLMEDFALAGACLQRGRIQRLPLSVQTSARRYEGRQIRSRLILAAFPTLFRLGVDPATLARWYGAVR